jgi:hypothetical protein
MPPKTEVRSKQRNSKDLLAIALAVCFCACGHAPAPPGAASSPPGAAPSGSPRGLLVLPLKASLDAARLHKYDQLQTNWCWAASAQMTIEYLKPQAKTEQCRIAGEELGPIGAPFNCCPLIANCNVPKWPQQVFHDRQITYAVNQGALTEDELKRQIVAGSPVMFSWNWTRGNAHIQVAVAYNVIDGESFISVLDPLSLKTTIPYSEYDKSEDHTHSVDYYAFEVQP